MKELGMVISDSGKIINFGQFFCGIKRDNDNSDHFHNPAFRKELLMNRDSFPFIKDVSNFDIVNNLNFMAENGCISLLNATQGTFEASVPMAVMTLPLNLSISQRKVLIECIDKISYFDGGLLYVEVVDSEGKVVYECNTVDELCSECIGVEYSQKKQANGFVKSYI